MASPIAGLRFGILASTRTWCQKVYRDFLKQRGKWSLWSQKSAEDLEEFQGISTWLRVRDFFQRVGAQEGVLGRSELLDKEGMHLVEGP